MSTSTVQCNVPPTFAIDSNDVFPFEQKSTNESNASEFVFLQLWANDALSVLLFRDLVIFD